VSAKVWLVFKVGVYDHDVWFVASSKEGAEAFTQSFRPDSDGHHQWDLREMAIDALPTDVRDSRVGKYQQGYNDVVRA
jgi:hypothetical protein